MREHYVYIFDRSRTLYTGATNDLVRRLHEHRTGANDGFTSRYRIRRLVYFEATPDVISAIAREKQIEGWRREKKVALITSLNPTWADLSADWQIAASSLRSE